MNTKFPFESCDILKLYCDGRYISPKHFAEEMFRRKEVSPKVHLSNPFYQIVTKSAFIESISPNRPFRRKDVPLNVHFTESSISLKERSISPNSISLAEWTFRRKW
ncbi:unnamed protein product [Rhizophagus irregularis]|nr:unnamed protein product [Rhizophagus irregularis]